MATGRLSCSAVRATASDRGGLPGHLNPPRRSHGREPELPESGTHRRDGIPVGGEQSCDGGGRRSFVRRPGVFRGLEGNVGNREAVEPAAMLAGAVRIVGDRESLAQSVAVGINGFQEVQVTGGRDQWSTVSEERFADLERPVAHPAELFA